MLVMVLCDSGRGALFSGCCARPWTRVPDGIDFYYSTGRIPKQIGPPKPPSLSQNRLGMIKANGEEESQGPRSPTPPGIRGRIWQFLLLSPGISPDKARFQFNGVAICPSSHGTAGRLVVHYQATVHAGGPPALLCIRLIDRRSNLRLIRFSSSDHA
jgi:hypothetical protein